MATATAPRRATRRGAVRRTRQSSSPAQNRARLRVVPKGYRTRTARRRHARRILAATSVSVCAIFFVTLAFQVTITQGQFRLQNLNKKVAAQKQIFIQRRSEVGQLEAPSRIMQEAFARFGMAQPQNVHYLNPVRTIKSGDRKQISASDDTLTEWAQLKHLQAGLP
jgi:hypothetical protein